jgi:hypothetical protein
METCFKCHASVAAENMTDHQDWHKKVEVLALYGEWMRTITEANLNLTLKVLGLA